MYEKQYADMLLIIHSICMEMKAHHTKNAGIIEITILKMYKKRDKMLK
jgi:hypothetical protein